MFINFSNHDSSTWTPAQKMAAEAYGEIVELPFPHIPPELSSEEITLLADEYVERIIQMDPKAVMCQGEFTLCYAVVVKLKSNGIKAVAACSTREVEEHVIDGTTKKIISFNFVRFREYP